MSADAVAEPTNPQELSDELTMLTEFLDFYRTVLLRKGSGLSSEQLTYSIASSPLTIGALIRHMTFVEDRWCDATFAGMPVREPWAPADWEADSDWEMTTAKGTSFIDLRADFERACGRSRSHVGAAQSLDAVSSEEGADKRFSLRWILIHMIEEYARHCGHADLIRESIDGLLGD